MGNSQEPANRKLASIDLFSIVLDPRWCEQHTNTLGHLWQRFEHEDGKASYCITGTVVQSESYFLRVLCSPPPNGAPQWARLPHQIVVAVLELASRQNQPGFVGQEESRE